MEAAMNDDRAFYERRLREELSRADSEVDHNLRHLHRKWANLYRRRLDRLRRPTEAAA